MARIGLRIKKKKKYKKRCEIAAPKKIIFFSANLGLINHYLLS